MICCNADQGNGGKAPIVILKLLNTKSGMEHLLALTKA
jgi:hypothetical protein